ncbi:MAG: hypothetical protein P1V35_06670, partial [Planctomycetota bacterium]|nr:hypothetical protein [Planctomycetota bacterium]
MRIKNKLLLLALAPILGTTALVSVGYYQLGNLREANRHLAEDQFGTLVQHKLPHLESLHKSIALLLNGDRDAYQVLQAELQIMDGVEGEALSGLIDQSAGNLDQVHERILKGGSALPPESNGLVTEFETQFAAWKSLHLGNLELAQTD